MADITFRTSTSGAWTTSSSTTYTITKPTGLTVGDLMIAHFALDDTSGVNDATRTGWTQVINADQFAARIVILWKIADASDVAASSFDFTLNASAASPKTGSISVFYNTKQTGTIVNFSSGGDTGSSPYSFANSITPSADSVLVMFLAGEAKATTYDNYAITNDNPTWTEMYDSNTTGGVDFTTAAAYSSIRTATTATGNSSVTTASAINSVCGIISIEKDILTADITDTMTLSDSNTAIRTRISTTTDTLDLTENISAFKVMFATIVDTLGMTEVVSGIRTRLSNIIDSLGLSEVISAREKWRNQTKNTSTYTNQTKNTSTWDNLDKS